MIEAEDAPRRLRQGFGLVALEAMACGTPSVVSDVPGHRDAVPDEVGIRVPLGDHRAMAEAAIGLLADPAATSALVERGLAHAARFSWDEAATSVEALLRAATRGGARKNDQKKGLPEEKRRNATLDPASR